MRRLPLLLLAWPLLAAAMPGLELDVSLDPASGRFAASARLRDDRPIERFVLAPEFEITAASVDGKPVRLAGRQGVYRLPAGSRQLDLAYRAELKPVQPLDHRQVLADRSAVASPEGSFLPAAARWYPDPGTPFAYRLGLRLPAGQKGLVEGNLLAESDRSDGYRAEFDFPHPAEGLHLMAGPYVVGERTLALGSRSIRIRTWFHGELAPLAQGYLDDTARYLERYSRLIGDYPFDMFSVVSSPTPTGFGMPTLTYLGRDVLRLPFIRATSLGHEVLHNWWGNGVYPDWDTGNWSEGLTTFLADYAYREDEGEGAAREMRLGWLRDYAAVPPGEDFALKDFTARRHGLSSIVGYSKSAMVFLMLRDEIGREAFERGLRLLWQQKRFRPASWSDLESAFASTAGRSLKPFFRQWVHGAGAPGLALKSATQAGDRLTLQVAGNRDYALRLALRLDYGGGSDIVTVPVPAGDATAAVKVAGKVLTVTPDPDYRLWRRVDPALLPPILREVFVAPQVRLIVADDEAGVRDTALALAARVLDARPARAEATPGSGPLLIAGTADRVDAWLARQHWPAAPEALPARGSARVWAARDRDGRAYAVIAARDAESLKALERALPHYGRQSWLVFDGPRATEKGTWAPRPSALAVDQVAAP